MRGLLLSSILTLGLFLLAPYVHAINYTGEAWLDWTSLRFSGIPISINSANQTQNVFIHPNSTRSDFSNEWHDHITNFSIPQVATALSDVNSSRVYASFDTFGSGTGNVDTGRTGVFSALGTGTLTISIDYTLQHIGVSTLQINDLHSSAGVGLSLFGENTPRLTEDHGLLTASSRDSTLSGTLTVTQAYQRGGIGDFSATSFVVTDVQGSSVPVPDMLWPTLAGIIGIACYVEWKKRTLTL